MKRITLMLALCACTFAWAQQTPHTMYPGQLLNPEIDYGYCGPPPRDENGKIIRSEDVKAAFLAQHPCPSTGLRTEQCPDWAMDHTRPLACGGCDSVSNLAWLHKSVKSAAGRPGFYPKDRIERKVYGLDPPIPDTDNCTFVTPERTLQ
ncbi:MAG: HNH endonuclease [Betaproteobacteria bacterium]|nr:HNH endonuclease [Betaproteobacteria bacterium]